MTAAVPMFCSCSSDVLPDPVQYAVSAASTSEPEERATEVELKTVKNEAAPDAAVPSPDSERTPDPEETSFASLSPQATQTPPADPVPAESLKPESVQHDPDPSPTPVPEPVRTAASEASYERGAATPTPKPTERPTATPKPTERPNPTPDREKENVPVVAREESPSPEPVSVTPSPEPTVSPTPAPTPSPTPPAVDEYELAARVAFFESGNEDGRKAVLSVIYNRCNSSRFGGGKTDIRTEVYRKNQFSVVKREDFLTAAVPDSLIRTARSILLEGGSVLPENVVFFRVASAGTEWGDKIYYDTIGGNCFFASAE